MEMNKDMVQGKWKQIKGELQKAWGKVTNDEWEKTKGDAKAIAGLIQQKYGKSKSDASKSVSDVFRRHVTEPTKEKLEHS